MKFQTSFFRLLTRFSLCGVCCLLEFVLTTPALRADDTTPGVYFWVGPNRSGGDGDVTDGNNWDPDDTGPPGGSVPGRQDSVRISPVNDSFGTHITLSGNLDVGGASIVGATMTGTVTVVGGLRAGTDIFDGGETIFEKSVTANGIGCSGVTFHDAVTASGTIDGGLQFGVGNGSNNFVQGSSLMVDHALGIGTSGNGLNLPTSLNFSGGATGIVHQAGQIIPSFNLPSTTAAFMEDGSTFNLSGSGTQFTVDGDFLVGLRFSLPFNAGANAAVNVTAGAKLITTGKTIVGPWFANTQETVNGGGEMTIDGASSQWLAQGDVIVGGPRRADGDPGSTGAVTISSGGALVAIGQKIVLGQAMGSEGTLNLRNAFSNVLSKDITIGSLGTGTLLVEDTGLLHNTGDAIVGEQAGSNGNATITGAGTKWQIDGNLIVGLAGDTNNKATGQVTIMNGAELTDNGSKVVLGQNANSVGLLTIDGANSKILGTGAANLVIGDHGKGVLVLQNGAQLTLAPGSGQLVLGSNSDGTGIIRVKDAPNASPSTFTAQDSLIVIGGAGRGDLDISNGGVVSSIGPVIIGRDSMSQGSVEISGTTSRWDHPTSATSSGASDVGIGLSGTGVLTVNQGATFAGGGFILGLNSDGNGTINLGGDANSTTTLAAIDLTIGAAGMGTLNAYAGSHISTLGAVSLGFQPGGFGKVDLNSTVWQMNGSVLSIGFNSIGGGDFAIRQGSTIQDAGIVLLGSNTATGILTIDGDSSQLNTGVLYLNSPDAGLNTLTVTNGGKLEAPIMTIAGNSSLTIDGTASSGGAKATIEAGALVIDSVRNCSLVVKNSGVLNITSGPLNFLGASNNLNNITKITIDSGAQLNALQSPLSYSNANAASSFNIAGGSVVNTASVTLIGIMSSAPVNIGNTGEASSYWNVLQSDGLGSFFTNGVNVNIHSSTLSVAGETLFGNATVAVEGTGASFQTSTLAIASQGTLQLTNNAVATINLSSAIGSVLVDSGAQLIANSGGSFNSAGAVHVAGSLDVSQGGYAYISNKLTIDGSMNVGDFSNTGGIDIGTVAGKASGGVARVGLGGTLKDNGMITASAVKLIGGTLGGSGTINGMVINGGNVKPGDPQTLTVNGDYQQLNGGLLQIAIAGKTMPEFDHLNVTGHVTLEMGSKLELDFMNGFAPKMGDKFDFLQSGDPLITDNFSEVVITGLEPGFQYVLAPDGVGSFGLVALNDGVSTTVPEPSTLVIVILGGLLVAAQVRWSRRLT